jgi:hypothetical protein
VRADPADERLDALAEPPRPDFAPDVFPRDVPAEPVVLPRDADAREPVLALEAMGTA